MKRSDLDKMLRSARLPGRPDEYWHHFPGRVTAKINQQSRSQPEMRPCFTPARNRTRFAAWGLGLATACVVIGLAIEFWPGRGSRATTSQLAEAKKYFHELAVLFPNQIQAIVFDQDGPHLILADKADVPDSPAIYVKICGPGDCRSFVTFSGQQIRANGERYEVLASPEGQVMLVGKQGVWSGAQPADSSQGLHIEARQLDAAL